jgi:hypothetical protein
VEKIKPPKQWAGWDRNADGAISIDEFKKMSAKDREALKGWIAKTLDVVDDNDFRSWAKQHFIFPAGGFMEQAAFWNMLGIPSTGIGDDVRDLPSDVKDAVTGPVKDAVAGVASSAFDSVAQRVGEAAADFTGYVGDEIAHTGRPQLEAAWYRRHYQRMLGWAGLLMLPLAMGGVGRSVVRGDSAEAGHTLMQVPYAYLLGVLAISLISAASGLAAAMSKSLVPGLQTSSRELAARVTKTVAISQPGSLSPGVVLLLGLLIALAALVTLVWLLLAEAAIYAVVLFIPLAFAGRVWEPARDWGRKLLTIAFSLVAAKVVVFAIWALAVDGLANASAGDVPLRSALALAALLLMTALAPSAVLRLVPMLEGAERAGSPAGAVRSGLSSAYYGAGLARMGSAALGSGRGGRGGGGLGVTSQIGGAAARAPAAAAGAGAAGAQPPVGGQGRAGRQDDQGGQRPAAVTGRRGSGGGSGSSGGRSSSPSTSTGGRGRGSPSGSSPATGRPASSGIGSESGSQSDTPRVAPPAPPPGTGSGRPWPRRD